MTESDQDRLTDDSNTLTAAVREAERTGTPLVSLPPACRLLPPDPSRLWRSAMPAYLPAAADQLRDRLRGR